MFYVSEPTAECPKEFSTDLQKRVYAALTELEIPFLRVDTDEAITMDDCVLIDERLDMQMVKTLFLCDRRQTELYLFITAGDKPFRSKDFSASLGVSRVSFAPPELMQSVLGTKIGAATVFSALLETARDVRIVFDKEVAVREWYGCSDGTTTGYMELRTSDILKKLLPRAGHSFDTIED